MICAAIFNTHSAIQTRFVGLVAVPHGLDTAIGELGKELLSVIA